MRASLAALIRLQTWRCEGGRRAVGSQLCRIEALDDRLQRLAESLLRERETALVLARDTVIDLSAYECRVAGERDALERDMADALSALATARTSLAAALAERRKLELAEEHRSRAELREQDRRERATLDEIALHRYAVGSRTCG